MKPQRLGMRAFVLLAAVSSGLAVAPLASVSAASSGFCSVNYSGTTITWTGKGNGHTWADAANWSTNTVPDAAQHGGTYQSQYVCIGDNKGGKSASVTIAGTDTFHIAGIDVGQGAHLSIQPGGGLYLGAPSGTAAVASSVDKHSQLQLQAAVLGGNSPLTVAGTLRWTAERVGDHKKVANQTSSECVFDPATTGCPGTTTRGGGRTIIAAGGKMLVDGTKFGDATLSDGRVIDNFGTITFTGEGFIAMNAGTQLIDEPHSSIHFDGLGGIYTGSTHGSSTLPKLVQDGALIRHGSGTNVVVVGVPVGFGKTKPSIKVLGGSIVLDRSNLPKAPVARAGGYGVGSCQLVGVLICKKPVATTATPQVALVQASSESAAPKSSNFSVALAKSPAKIHGHAVLGKAIDITGPTKHTTHSTHLTFMFDSTTHGLTSTPIVYRNSHRITLCKVHGLTALNTSCVFTESVAHSGSNGSKGDLTIFIITIQPDAHWHVAH
jgi:hypothetical protein